MLKAIGSLNRRAAGLCRRGAAKWPSRSRALLVGLLALTLTPGILLAGCATAAPDGRVAYLTAQVDYPHDLLAGDAGSVTVRLVPHGKLAGSTAEETQTAPVVSLPTNLSGYADILVSADAVGDGRSPVAWRLSGDYRQSLLSAASASRLYRPVTFRWQVTGLNAGRNTEKIVLGIVYVYRDGTEHAGSIELTARPVPVAVRTPTLVNVYLAPRRTLIVLIAGLLGALTLLWFVWGVTRVMAQSAARKAAPRAAPVLLERPERGLVPPASQRTRSRSQPRPRRGRHG